MKVAIIGAGLSGMACAYELEQNGIYPTIYEQRHTVGEAYHHVGAMMQLIYRPVKEPLRYLQEQFNIYLSPLAPMTHIEMNAANVTRTVEGNLGWFFKRGPDMGTLETQLLSLLKSRIIYNTYMTPELLPEAYDYIVVATGNNGTIPSSMGLTQTILQTWVRGQVILGEFDPNRLIMWTNTNYLKNGYAYLTPFDKNRASLIMIVPNTTRENLDYYWNLFVDLEKLNYTTVKQFEEDHTNNYVYPKQVGNIMFIGTAGGFMDPFLGFGLFSAIGSGNLAAKAIITGQSFTSLSQTMASTMKKSIAIRKHVDIMDNKKYDMLVTFLGNPLISQLLYKTNINFLKYTSESLTLLNKIFPIKPKT